MTGPIEFVNAIEEIPIQNEEIPAQHDAYWTYYYLAFPVAEGSYHRSFEVRLYRRGFETAIIESRAAMTGMLATPLDLTNEKRAETVEAQEKAIDDVLSGLYSWQNAQASAFLADEYLALARSPKLSGPEHEKTRNRLEEKAKKTRAGDRYLWFTATDYRQHVFVVAAKSDRVACGLVRTIIASSRRS
jgi:hypothetical protein